MKGRKILPLGEEQSSYTCCLSQPHSSPQDVFMERESFLFVIPPDSEQLQRTGGRVWALTLDLE